MPARNKSERETSLVIVTQSLSPSLYVQFSEVGAPSAHVACFKMLFSSLAGPDPSHSSYSVVPAVP